MSTYRRKLKIILEENSIGVYLDGAEIWRVLTMTDDPKEEAASLYAHYVELVGDIYYVCWENKA